MWLLSLACRETQTSKSRKKEMRMSYGRLHYVGIEILDLGVPMITPLSSPNLLATDCKVRQLIFPFEESYKL